MQECEEGRFQHLPFPAWRQHYSPLSTRLIYIQRVDAVETVSGVSALSAARNLTLNILGTSGCRMG